MRGNLSPKSCVCLQYRSCVIIRLPLLAIRIADLEGATANIEVNYWVSLLPENTQVVAAVTTKLEGYTTAPPTEVLANLATLLEATSIEATFLEPKYVEAQVCPKKFRFEEKSETCLPCEVENCDRCAEEASVCQVCSGDDPEKEHWALSSANECVKECEADYEKTFVKFTDEDSGYRCEPSLLTSAGVAGLVISLLVVLVVIFILLFQKMTRSELLF